jgi:hypothetical protein
MLSACGAPISTGGVTDVPMTTCASGLEWTGGNRESGLMHPGQACIACHSSGEGPLLTLAGTVYSAANEADDCGGASTAGLEVVVTDANNVETRLTPNSMGNFYLERVSIALPFHAKVVNGGGGVLEMAAAQTVGDCNSCHTQTGANATSGRILAP